MGDAEAQMYYKTKAASFPKWKLAAFCWGTRTRTRKDRTRICSVANYTIPQTLKFDSLPKQIELLGYPDSNQERQDQNL